jgi:hypothetical protein
MTDLLTLAILRRVLEDYRDLALIALEDLMLKYGATDEELEREAAFWMGVKQPPAGRRFQTDERPKFGVINGQ